jgi:hypothetical protein
MGADPGALTGAVRDGLRALAAGRWARWRGLVTLPGEAVVEQALGRPLDDEARSGMLGGSPTFFRRYPATDGAPQGITVWFEDELAVAVEIWEPVGTAGSPLGPPDATIESAFGRAWGQELYPLRGLVLHRRGDEVALLYGLRPFTLDEWMADPLRHSGPPERHAHE